MDENGRYYPDFPVPRFRCHGKGISGGRGSRIFPHKTFSLLHYHLVPYWKYSIPFIIKVLKKKHINGLTLKLLQDYIADLPAACTCTADSYIELSTSRIYSFHRLIGEAITKLLISGYYHELSNRFYKYRYRYRYRGNGGERERIKAFLEFSKEFECCKVSVPIRGPCALSYDFYLQGGSYLRNSHFLFGTPSQFRAQGID